MPSTHVFQADARARLNAFLAGVNELPAGDRANAMREYLERGLERLQALEEQHYAFLAECALLAADNVQDVRLYDLERQVQQLTNPESDWGEVMVGVALNVALQIAALVAWEAAVAVAVAVIGKGVVAQTMRSAAASYDAPTRLAGVRAAYRATLQGRSALNRANDRLDSMADDLEKGILPDGGHKVSLAPDGSAPLLVNNWFEWHAAKTQVAKQREALNAEALIVRRAYSENNVRSHLAYLEAQRDANAAGDKAIQEWSAEWRDFVGGERGGMALGPAYTVLEKMNADLLRVQVEAARPRVPITSEVAGRFLGWARQRQLEAADDWASWRLGVRYCSDDALKNDPRFAGLAQLVAEALPQFEVQHGLTQAGRSAMVIGFEAAYWLEILRANGYLDVQRSKFVLHDSWHAPGNIVDGHVLIEAVGEVEDPLGRPLGTWWDADLYVGVAQMTEVQATYLFHRYAKAWYRNPSNLRAAALPFEYVVSDYASMVAEQPKLWEDLLWSYEHKARLDQMKLMVVKYFMLLPKRGVHPEVELVLPGMGRQIEDLLAGMPAGKVPPPPPDNAAATLNALDAAREPLQMLYEAAGISPQTEFNMAALHFADQLLLVEQRIEAFQLLKEGAAEQLGTGVYRYPEDLFEAICRERGEVADQYAQLEQMAHDAPLLSAWLEQTFGARRTALAGWTAGDTDQCWKFYGESESESEPLPQ